ncbi:unnamed protein product [Symbiodinium sp. CCMP2592]|nr:unnamed protein product [Symbiodinium sp. CCMP2592]
MPRTPKWIPCACGYHWAWKRQVESGENTHCAYCGRNWQKQLAKQQANKEARAENSQSPRAVWEDGRTKGKGKGEGKGSKNLPGGKVGAVLAGLWKDLPEAAQKAFQEVGYSPPRPKGPPPPPPGLDLQSLLKGRMTEKEYNAARAVVYAGAGLHVQTLLEAAGIPPPPDEDLDRPEPTPQEKLTRCVSDFKKATNQMKNLVEKKAKLQARADKLKQELEKLIGDVDQVDKDIKAKDVEIQETAKAFKEMTADSTSTAFSALEAVLSEAGHELNEATRAKMKAALVGKEDLPPDPFIVGFRGHDEYFPREMPPMYGPARTDPHGKRPTPLEGTKPEAATTPNRGA